jgi:hypothetical protein
MSPVSLASLPNAVKKAAYKGIRDGVRDELGHWIHPKVAEKIGFGVGVTVMAIGYSMRVKHNRWRRIEQKLDNV